MVTSRARHPTVGRWGIMGDHSWGWDHWGITDITSRARRPSWPLGESLWGSMVTLRARHPSWALGDHWGIAAGGITGGSLCGNFEDGPAFVVILFSQGKNP